MAELTATDWADLLAALEHFLWLDAQGALTREEAPHLETFRRLRETYAAPSAGA